MKHKAHKRISHLKKRYKHIAAAFAGAILISSALLPGIPVSTAHAAMKSNAGNSRDTIVEKMENENRVKSLEGKKGKRSSSEIKNTIRQNLRMNAEKESKISSEKAKKDSQKSQNISDSKENKQKKQSKDAPRKYEKVLDIKATAYSPGPLDNDQWGDKTYLGTTIRPGVVAVDPKVIPLGSRLYVEYPDGRGEYAVAEDTGGAIKGNRIDIAIMNRDKATEFGIKPVKVYVVNTPKERG